MTGEGKLDFPKDSISLGWEGSGYFCLFVFLIFRVSMGGYFSVNFVHAFLHCCKDILSHLIEIVTHDWFCLQTVVTPEAVATGC